jgi:hypothetical protein
MPRIKISGTSVCTPQMCLWCGALAQVQFCTFITTFGVLMSRDIFITTINNDNIITSTSVMKWLAVML